MNRALRAALAPLKAAATGPRLFVSRDGTPYRSFRTAFKTACRHADLKDVTPHVLRHTFASRLVMKGVDLRTVQELGGWSSLELVQRYAHLSPGHRAEAVERLVRPATLSATMDRACSVNSHAPVAQVDRAAVS